MKIRWLGHASFLITSDDGFRVITDPYTTGRGIEYGEIRESADAVVVSHGHGDHSNVGAVGGDPVVLNGPGTRTAGGVAFEGVACHHDPEGGALRGPNTAYAFAVDGVRVSFLGDLGHPLTLDQAAAIGAVDVLLVPVGGTYTIDAGDADRVCDALRPRVVIPMHYKTDKCAYPIGGVEAFLKGKPRVRRVGASEVEFTAATLPAEREVVVLEHAL